MKIGMIGGSFNPVHNGHMELAKNAVKSLNLDKLIFVPAFVSPFKQEITPVDMGISDKNRLEMLQLAISESSCDKLIIDTCEIDRGGVSYTMDTVEYLNRKYKTRIYLIIGDDLVKDFDKWNEPKKLSKIAQIVLARRHFEKPIEFAYEHISIKNPIVNGASSDVRKLVLTASCGWEKYLSAEVSDYIKLNGLYGYWQGVTKKVTAALKINVSEHRYEHSLRVAQMMDKLCKHYDLDREKGYFAGISHDLCKRMNEKDMLEIVSIDGMPLTEVEKEFPVLLHGRAAAVKLAKDFGIIHKDVLEAVAFHTFGKPHMSEIGMMLFVADKIEPERQQTNPEYYERLFSLSLNEMTLSVLEENIEYLHNKGKVASDLSLEMQKWLKKEIYDK